MSIIRVAEPPSETKPGENLALFVSGSMELLELLQFREDAAADPDATPAEISETLKACDVRIEEYVRQEIQRVDGIAAYLREFEARIAALGAEKVRLAYRIDDWQQRYNRIEKMVEYVMGTLGTKKLEGTNATLLLKKNPASVDIAQPELVPAQYKKITVTMTPALFESLVNVLMRDDKSATVLAELLQAKRTEPEVSKSKVAEELKQPKGSVPGARLINDRYHLEIK